MRKALLKTRLAQQAREATTRLGRHPLPRTPDYSGRGSVVFTALTGGSPFEGAVAGRGRELV